MTIFALFVLASVQQDAGPLVTAEIRAGRAAQVLAELSQKVGLKLEASPVLANEILVVKAKDVPRDTLMAKLASVVSGEWKADGDVMRLTASSAAWNREQQEANTRRIAATRKALQEMLNKQNAKPKAKSANPDEVDEAAPGAPFAMGDMGINGKTFTGLLQGIDLTPIALLSGGDRVVYSTSPTAMQRPLGRNATQLINALVADHNSRIGPAHQPSEEEEKMLAALPEYVREMANREQKKIENPQKALLIASKTDFGVFGMTQLELRIYDADGKVVYSTTQMFGRNMDELIKQMMPGGKKPAAPSLKEVTYSADSKALMQSLQGLTGGGGTIKLDPKVVDKLAQPDKYDPLGYMATDELYSLASAKGKALVANLPDAMMSSIGMFMPGGTKQTVEDVQNDLVTGDDATLAETDGWLVVKPARPLDSRASRTDRLGLAKLVQKAREKVVPSLDDIAEYAQTSPSPMENGIGQFYAALVVPGMMPAGMSGITDWNVIRFYGTLTTQQRQNLGQGGRLPFGMMAPAQQALWRQVVFGTGAHIMVGEVKGDDPFTMMMSMGMGGMMQNDYRQEPTELMPNGVPGEASVTVSTTTQPFASTVGSGEASMLSGYLGVVGIDELAMFKMFKEEPSMAAVSGFMPAMDKLRVGQRSVHSVRMSLPQQAFILQTLNDNRLPKDAPVVSMSNLPPEFQKQLDERVAVLKKSPFGSIIGMMGGMRGPIKPE